MKKPPVYGDLAQTIHEAVRIWQVQKADGVPWADRVAGLERTLRAAWPQTREWKYLCQRCHDYGLEMGSCPGDATCGKSKPHGAHEFGRPCWCDAGRRFREKPKEQAGEDDYLQAGKTPSRRMTRFGR